jgi:hypothetical protein
MNRLCLILAFGLAYNPLLATQAQTPVVEQGLHERLTQVRSCVISVARVEPTGGVAKIIATHGTAFLIGNRGFALTAKHVIAGRSKPLAALTMTEAGGWTWSKITASELHPSEDVAIIKLDASSCRSGYRISSSVEVASSKYRIYGYPGDATRFEPAKGEFPDLVYTEGYIRRRYSASLYPSAGPLAPAGTSPVAETLQISGTGFFELSQIAGAGTSGGPVFDLADPMQVIGIYSAEKHTPHVIQMGGQPVTQLTSVSYAVRDDAFRNWKPAMLDGRTVLEESQ